MPKPKSATSPGRAESWWLKVESYSPSYGSRCVLRKGEFFYIPIMGMGYFGPSNLFDREGSGFLGPSFYTPENERLET